MSKIRGVSVLPYYDEIILTIVHNNNVLRIPYTHKNSEDCNKINLDGSGIIQKFNFKSYNDFDKSKILEIQNILLNAYVFSHDALDKALKEEASIKDLDNLKKCVLA